MKKLILTCACGQRVQLPRSAVGKTGICPTCSRAIHITKENTRPLTAEARQRARLAGNASGTWKPSDGGNEEAKRLFGRAADLYCEGRYGEALSIFDSLARRFPGIPEIENARRQCMEARSRGHMALPGPGGAAPIEPKADPETIKEFVLRKMFHAKSEETQLHAAELMAKILGMLPAKPQPQPANDEVNESPAETTSKDVPVEDESSNAEEDVPRSNISEFSVDPKRGMS